MTFSMTADGTQLAAPLMWPLLLRVCLCEKGGDCFTEKVHEWGSLLLFACGPARSNWFALANDAASLFSSASTEFAGFCQNSLQATATAAACVH